MYSKQNHTPRWTMLNLIVLVAIGGLALEHNLHLTPVGHKITLFLLVAVLYGLMGLWVKSNATALEDIDTEERRRQSHYPTQYGTSAFPTHRQPHFQETVSYYRRKTMNKQEKR